MSTTFLLLASLRCGMVLADPALLDDVAVLAPGPADGTIALRLSYPENQARQVKDSLVTAADIGVPLVPEVTFVQQAPLPGKSNARYMLLVFSVHGMPTSTTQTRYLQIKSNGVGYTVAYTLTNEPRAKFSWTISGPPNMAIDTDYSIPVTIATGPVAATNVHLAQPFIMEKDRQTPLGVRGLELCTNPDGECTPVKDLPANSSSTVFMQGKFDPGRYAGTIAIVCDQKSDDKITVELSVSSVGVKILGAGLIFIGVLIGWYITVFARNVIARDQLLLPATEIRAQLTKIDDALQMAVQDQPGAPPAPHTTQCIEQILDALSDANLEAHGLPGSRPALWQNPLQTSVDTYRQYLAAQSAWLPSIGLIAAALPRAWAMWSTDQPMATAVTTCVQGLDNLAVATAPPDPATLQPQISALLAALNAARSAPAAAGMMASSASPPLTTSELRMQISHMSDAAWVFIFAATTLLGSYLLIFQSSVVGFGTPSDLLVCLLWGFGLSSGSQVANATSTSISTTFGISH